MSRLAEALVRMAEGIADANPRDRAFVAIRGVDATTAEGMAAAWRRAGDGFALRVVAPAGRDLRGAELQPHETATAVRNDERHQRGVCLVICEGQRIEDGQGMKGLDAIEPSALLADEPHWRLLCDAAPALTGPEVNEVGAALRSLNPSERPTPIAAAAFLDALAAGGTAGSHLAHLDAFSDSKNLNHQRLAENLQLAAALRDPETTRAGAARDISARADDALPAEKAARVRALLHSDPASLVRELTFEEAVKVLRDPPAKDLPESVKEQLDRFRSQLGEHDDARDTVDDLLGRAEALRDKDERQDAADDLLGFAADHSTPTSRVFREDTERRLKQLRRSSKIAAGSSVERALVRAAAGVGLSSRPLHEDEEAPVGSLRVRTPLLPERVERESDAKAVFAWAALRLRAEPLLDTLRGRGVKVDDSTTGLLDDLLDQAIGLLDTPRPGLASSMTIAVFGRGRGNVVEVNWSPSQEDVVLVMVNHRFRQARRASLMTAIAPGNPLRAPELEGAPAATTLDEAIGKVADDVAAAGFSERVLERWATRWIEAVDEASGHDPTRERCQKLTAVGCIEFPESQALLLTHLHPLKAEWLAERSGAWTDLLDLLFDNERSAKDVLAAAAHLASANASQYPASLYYGSGTDPLVPGIDGEVISQFGATKAPSNINPPPVASVEQVLTKLVKLHPEVEPQVRIAALGDHACDLALRALLGKLALERRPFERAELVCIDGAPSTDALRDAEKLERSGASKRIGLRYVAGIDDLRAGKTPEVHLAVISGLGERAGSRNVRFGEATIADPSGYPDPLFAPKTWLRVNRSEEILLCPPGVTDAYSAHLAVQAAPREGWRSPDEEKGVPTLSVDVGGVRKELDALHRYAQWVLTVDRYAARDTLERLLGDSVAILHQERRTSGAVTEGLIISQRSGGAADRAIARALTTSRIEPDEAVAVELAHKLRASASKGHGVLALRAATTGSGINELIGHVAGFAELTRRASPQPIPADSRLILISLDEYSQWFGRGKRADLLVLALPRDADREVWAANVEVKTVLSTGDQAKALREAKTQLLETLKDSQPAIRPDESVFSRMWLNRIVEAAISVVRENNVRLSTSELDALNRFRDHGTPSNDWGGIGLVFGPEELQAQTPQVRIGDDRIPLFLYGVKLDRDMLESASRADPGKLITGAGEGREVRSSTKNRARRSAGGAAAQPAAAEEEEGAQPAGNGTEAGGAPLPDGGGRGSAGLVVVGERLAAPEEAAAAPARADEPALLGINASTNEPVEWRVSGPGALSNGHVEVYGQSGYGKTQFVKSLLAQLRGAGSNFTVCDFKDDYGLDSHGTFFPDAIDARFFRLKEEPVPFNPMAGHSGSQREMQSFCIELRDVVDIAAKQHVRMGPRQLGKLMAALEETFEMARVAGNGDPVLQDIAQVIDDDLNGIIGDLFRFEYFSAGPPFGDLVDHDTIFSFADLPGRGLTEDLLAGFILSSFYLKMQTAAAVHSSVRFAVVVDEAHRVRGYKAIKAMVSEQRSKGVAVILATQKPGQLPPEVETNAQTKVFLRLPGQDAKEAAKRLDPTDRDLPDLIRNLAPGEAFVSLGGPPTLIRLRQFWRDDQPGT